MGPWSLRAAPDPLASAKTSGDSLPAMPLETVQSSTPIATSEPPSPAPALSAEQEIALNNAIAEVRATRPLDPADEHELRTLLRRGRQEDWPLVLKHFQSSLAYREQLLAAEKHEPTDRNPVAHATSLPAFPQPTEQTHSDLHASETVPPRRHTVQLASHQEPVSTPSEPLPVRGSTVANITASQPASVDGQSADSSPTSRSANADWKSQLAATIDSMRQDVKSNPGSTDEMQEHMRLRMLMLMAGLENDSLMPIPGATAAEQDYWSKQLFALSTYFDSERQPDMKQRAAGSLVHLDAARAKLAELATLQVRNLTFVQPNSVDGYGLYEIHEVTKFKPGDQVTLYAEVDNFRSESTKEGYRTALATSYEVVDPQGNRVDGAQFPEVVDICRAQRRDFHMVYGIALPTRIYPGKYELRLTITDQLSNKIGRTSVSFEIVE